jgi:hypothetical protein
MGVEKISNMPVSLCPSVHHCRWWWRTKPEGFARPEAVANRLAGRLQRDQRVKTKRDLNRFAIWMIIGNENDQVSKGHLVDALACTGDEGRDTLR